MHHHTQGFAHTRQTLYRMSDIVSLIYCFQGSLTVYSKLDLNSESSCLSFLRAGITSMHHRPSPPCVHNLVLVTAFAWALLSLNFTAACSLLRAALSLAHRSQAA